MHIVPSRSTARTVALFFAASAATFIFSACAGGARATAPAAHAGENAEAGPANDQAPSVVPPASAGEATEDRDGGIAESRGKAADRTELTVAFSSGELELDPRKSYTASEAQIFTALYEGLFSYHPFTLEPVPALASRWELSEDKRVWTFTIRDGARYWNGDEVRSEHFRDAWLSLIAPGRDAPYSSLFDLIQGARDYRLGLTKDAASVGIEAPNGGTLIVRLSSPASFFPSMLSHHSFAPVHPSMLGVEDWSATPPISNGPFYVVERRDDRLIMAKNELYWDAGQTSFARLIVRFVADGAESAALWDSGEARWIAGEVDLDALKDRSGIVVNAMFATHYYFIRSGAEPWKDRRVRRALSLALPWGAIREGHYLPADTLIFPIPGYPKPQGLTETHLEEARELLSQAGYPRGVGLPELLIRITPSQDAARIADLMARAWKEELGVPVRVEVVPFAAYFQSLKRSDYVVGSSTWIGDFADPYTFLQMWRRDSNLNDARYDDQTFEDLIERSMALEGEERWKLLSEAESELLQGGTVIPISYTPALNIIDMNEIDGWFPNALDIHPFKYLSFAAYRPLPGIAGISPAVRP